MQGGAGWKESRLRGGSRKAGDVNGVWTYGALVMWIWVAGWHPGVRRWVAAARWLRPMLAGTAWLLAVIWMVSAVGAVRGGLFRLASVFVLALVLGPLAGRGMGFQRRLNPILEWAAQHLTQMGRMGAGPGIGTCAVLLTLNPAGWIAAWVSGSSEDPRGLVWKAVLDGLTLLGLPVWRPVWGGSALLLTLVVQGLVARLGESLRPSLMAGDGVSAALLVAGAVWLTLPLLVLGIRRVPLADMAMAIPAALLLTWIWR